MTNHSVTGLRLLDRRQVMAGLAAAGLASLAGIDGIFGASTAASGTIGGAGLTELATYTGWRRSWDLIVPLSANRAFPRTVLLYDRSAGEATLLAVERTGQIREVQRFAGWRRSWDAIVPSGFPRALGVTGLIAYDKTAGALSTLRIDQFGTLQELRANEDWRRTWTNFVPIGTAGFLAYDRPAGFASLFGVDAAGEVSLIRSDNDWRPTWDLLTSGPFTTGATASGDLLLYDRTAREAEGIQVLGTGETAPFADYSDWRSTWSSMQGGLFLVQGDRISGVADLMLFDRAAQELEFLDIGPDSLLTSLLLTPTPGARSWSSATGIGPDLVLLYDRVTGVAGLYVTDQAMQQPAPIPTATATPPLPPTPTPPIVRTGSTVIRLQQGRGSAWDTYTAKSDDPRSGPGQNAYITGVENAADIRIALIHRENSGRRTGPVFLKAGEVSSAYNGMLVGGDWEATVTASERAAPRRIRLEVSYEIR